MESAFVAGTDKPRRFSKTQKKKMKKYVQTVHDEDLDRQSGFRSEARRLPRIPRGKTVLKQLFAGIMGLTFLATVAGWKVAQPLDLDLGWGASTRTGTRTLNRQLQQEDPYFTVITFPCGPWTAGRE